MPLSGADNESTLDEAAIETEMFQESYHAKNYSPIGKKRIFLNQNAMTERMREDLGMNWTPSRMEKGAYATMDSNLVEDETLSYNGGDKVPQIGQPKHLPEAGQMGIFMVRQKSPSRTRIIFYTLEKLVNLICPLLTSEVAWIHSPASASTPN